MNILVCVKQVPDTTEIKIDPVTNTLIRAGVPSIVNPFDAYALEMAVRLKEKAGGKITVVSMGPAQAKEALKSCLAVGADQAFLVTDRAFGGSDTLATSYILSCAVKKMEEDQGAPFDFIFCGKQAIDGDTGQTAPSIAEHLGATRLTYVLSLKVEGGKVIAERQVEEGVEVIETKFPVLCTATKESNKPRYATVKGVMRSFNTEIGQITLADLPDADTTKMGLKGSPTKVKATFTPKRTANCVNIEGVSPVEIADNLIGKLVEAKVL